MIEELCKNKINRELNNSIFTKGIEVLNVSKSRKNFTNVHYTNRGFTKTVIVGYRHSKMSEWIEDDILIDRIVDYIKSCVNEELISGYV